MARGPAPKDASLRRRRNKPAAGEWTDLELPTGKAPAMPAAPKGGWAVGTKAAWKSWWSDPASTMWTPADRENLRAVAYLHHEVERGWLKGAGEVRLRLDGLGLTAKGKQQLRWRYVEGDVDEQSPAKRPSRRDHLRVVGA